MHLKMCCNACAFSDDVFGKISIIDKRVQLFGVIIDLEHRTIDTEKNEVKITQKGEELVKIFREARYKKEAILLLTMRFVYITHQYLEIKNSQKESFEALMCAETLLILQEKINRLVENIGSRYTEYRNFVTEKIYPHIRRD